MAIIYTDAKFLNDEKCRLEFDYEPCRDFFTLTVKQGDKIVQKATQPDYPIVYIEDDTQDIVFYFPYFSKVSTSLFKLPVGEYIKFLSQLQIYYGNIIFGTED